MGRLIAIGDIHGCRRALQALGDAIAPNSNDILIPLGDTIDRGPDSKGVLDTLLQLRKSCQVIPILGNHEELMLAAIRSSVDLRAWIQSGGAKTLDSYGPGSSVDQIPVEHIDFLHEFRDYYESDTHIFLHASYQAELPLDKQPGRTLRWEFCHHRLPPPHHSGKTVVVGHSPQTCGEILDLGYLVCIETNVGGGGWLTAMEVRTGQLWQADHDGRTRA